MCELIVFAQLALRTPLNIGGGPFQIGRRDQAKLSIEDMDQIVEVPGAARIPRSFEQFLARFHLSLDVGAALGQRTSARTALAAFWCMAMLESGAVEAAKVSSRKVNPFLGAFHLLDEAWVAGSRVLRPSPFRRRKSQTDAGRLCRSLDQQPIA